ncbi:methanobactin export MATE transporter MbnM [Pseudaestuariivita rosea]|uniref:methanobactin export MATE transporter MbnM n=1 Tax=Pseudaestuariivita rosea TaxID=2763263 RepID=UPI001ABBE12C|nr:methanobactin export MATE transporter MbnM [Pseudaestuariivita rosea]
MRRLIALGAAILAVPLLFVVVLDRPKTDTGSELILDHLGYRWNMPAWMAPPPVPDDNPMSVAKVDLGRHLFYDARLSADQTVSCASCHEQELAFTDGRVLSRGVLNTPARKNAPSIANAGYNPALTWANPHTGTLEFQALFPLFGTEPVEMGMSGREQELFARLASDPYYTDAFKAAFPEREGQIDLFSITRALGAFQRSIISANSPYDQFKYGGDPDALSEAAKRGEQLFFDHRFECYHCYMGVMFNDNMQTARSPFAETAYHNTGLYNIGGTGAYPPHQGGLVEFTGRREDIGKLRTPSLRNMALTAPYMHDGSIGTLREVIEHYAAGGRTIIDGPYAGVGAAHPNKSGLLIRFEATDREIDDLIAFLESLTDESLLTNPDYADPWPNGHSATVNRVMPSDTKGLIQ